MSKSHRIKCKCGATYKVRKKQVGKKTKCLKCGLQFLVPGTTAKLKPSDRASQISSTETKQPTLNASCPDCGKPMESNKKLCQSCGYHQGLGTRLKSETDHNQSDPQSNGILTLLSYFLPVGLIFWINKINPMFEGPPFLALYFGLFLAFGIATALFRHFVLDADYLQDAALFGLLGVGGMRIYYSVTNERYKFLLLILGMVITFAVFFLTKTRERIPENSPFVNDSGGLKMPRYWGAFCVGIIILAVSFFTPFFRSFGNGIIYAIVLPGILSFGAAMQFAGIDLRSIGGSGGVGYTSGSGGVGYTSGSGCGGGGCGGGGCGGGCGGGGCGG